MFAPLVCLSLAVHLQPEILSAYAGQLHLDNRFIRAARLYLRAASLVPEGEPLRRADCLKGAHIEYMVAGHWGEAHKAMAEVLKAKLLVGEITDGEVFNFASTAGAAGEGRQGEAALLWAVKTVAAKGNRDRTISMLLALDELYLSWGLPAEAEDCLRCAERVVSPADVESDTVKRHRARHQGLSGKWVDAEKTLAETDAITYWDRAQQAEVQARVGQSRKAILELERIIKLNESGLRDADGYATPSEASYRLMLAEAMDTALRDPMRVTALLDDSVQQFADALGTTHPEYIQARRTRLRLRPKGPLAIGDAKAIAEFERDAPRRRPLGLVKACPEIEKILVPLYPKEAPNIRVVLPEK